MKILNYVLIAIIAIVPKLWIDDYTITNPIWWTVTQAWMIGNCLGYLEGLHKKKEEKENEE